MVRSDQMNYKYNNILMGISCLLLILSGVFMRYIKLKA